MCETGRGVGWLYKKHDRLTEEELLLMMDTFAGVPGEAQAISKGVAAAQQVVTTNWESASQIIDKEKLKRDIARSVLGAFGLRPFHVFDGERYHVCFAAAKELVGRELNYDVELLEDFFSNCRPSPTSSNAYEARSPASSLREAPNATPPSAPEAEAEHPRAVAEHPRAEAEHPRAEVEENEQVSESDIRSPREVYYIMEEHYLSEPPSHTPREIDLGVENEPVVEDEPTVKHQPVLAKKQHVSLINPRTMREIHFVMQDNNLSPEELRLSVCFPLLFSPPTQPNDALHSAPNDVPMDDAPPSEERPFNDHMNGGNGVNNLDASTRSKAGRVNDDKGSRPKKKKAKVVEEFDASQSVRPDKPWTVKASPRKRKAPHKTGTKEPAEEEPSWNGLNVGTLEEQIGDSWVEDEKLRGSLEENPGDVVNPGLNKKSFWPSPLYGSPGCQVKAHPPPLAEKGNRSPSFMGSEEESSEVEDFEESLEHARKREEVALAKYALLFKDDQSWRKKFLDGLKLTCDICFSKSKIKVFSSVMSLLAHAQEVKKLRQPEHRGYAQAIRNLLHLDEPGNTPACHSVTGEQSFQSEGVWPPVVVLENTLIGVDFEGSLISLNTSELMHMLRALGDQGKRKLHPVVRENTLTGQVLVEFPTTQRGWIDAKHMHHQFELHARSYEDWLRLKPKFKALLCVATEVQESSGLLAVLEDKVSVKRILYGYLATPRVIKHIDPNKRYVDWEIANLTEFFDIADSDCSQALQA